MEWAAMKPVHESLPVGRKYEDWVPLMELATREVFDMMLGCQLAKPGIAGDETFDTTSMVGLAGKVCGMLTCSCGAKAATLMASKMLGVPATAGSREVLDALGEVCNMIAGNFKNKVPGLGEGCMLSVPTVITGKNYSMHSLAESAALEVRLLFEGMPVAISLRIRG
jgi:chemotaxis protein CheX